MVKAQRAQGDSNGDSKAGSASGSGVELSPVTVERLETFRVAAGQGLVSVAVLPNEFSTYGQTRVTVGAPRMVMEPEPDFVSEEKGRTATAQVLEALRVEGEKKACRMMVALIREAGETLRSMPTDSMCLDGGEIEGRDHNRPTPEQITMADEVSLWFQLLPKKGEGQALFTRVFGQGRSYRWMARNLPGKLTHEGWRRRLFRETCDPILCALQKEPTKC